MVFSVYRACLHSEVKQKKTHSQTLHMYDMMLTSSTIMQLNTASDSFSKHSNAILGKLIYDHNIAHIVTLPVYEVAVDLWSDTIALE